MTISHNHCLLFSFCRVSHTHCVATVIDESKCLVSMHDYDEAEVEL